MCRLVHRYTFIQLVKRDGTVRQFDETVPDYRSAVRRLQGAVLKWPLSCNKWYKTRRYPYSKFMIKRECPNG